MRGHTLRQEPSLRGDPRLRRAIHTFLVLVALVPLLDLIAFKLARLDRLAWLSTYGVTVLASTVFVLYLAFAKYRDPSHRRRHCTWAPHVTALVAVKDEEALIARCVDSLLASSDVELDVIVVDDASTDGTPSVLARYESDPRVTVLFLPENVGKKRALTAGLRLARGNVLAFTDSDSVLAPDAISRCVRALAADPEIGAVSGHARALNRDSNLLTRVQDTWYDGQFGVLKAAESVFGSVTCVSGPLAVFRREAVYNYFPAWADDRFLGDEFLFATDRQLTGYVLGQPWFGERLKRRHRDSHFVVAEDHPVRWWRVEYVRSARVWTQVPSRARVFLRQQIRWKKSFIRNLFFTGRIQWRRGVGAAWLYYSHAVWVFFAPLMAFRHLIWLPLHGEWRLSLLYIAGVSLKGLVWAIAYRVQNHGCRRWIYRPLMTFTSVLVLSWLLPYSAVTIRRKVWARG